MAALDGAETALRPGKPAGELRGCLRKTIMAFAEFETNVLPCEGLTAASAGDDLYQAGLAYSLGDDVEVDLVAAHKFFNLAVAKGHDAAKELRQEMADQMSSDEVRQALKAAREWLRLMN